MGGSTFYCQNCKYMLITVKKKCLAYANLQRSRERAPSLREVPGKADDAVTLRRRGSSLDSLGSEVGLSSISSQVTSSCQRQLLLEHLDSLLRPSNFLLLLDQ